MHKAFITLSRRDSCKTMLHPQGWFLNCKKGAKNMVFVLSKHKKPFKVIQRNDGYNYNLKERNKLVS